MSRFANAVSPLRNPAAGSLAVLLAAVSCSESTGPGLEAPPERVSLIGKPYSLEPDGLHQPTDIAQDREGNLYIADGYFAKIKKFTPDGDYLFEYSAPAPAFGPIAVAVGHDGMVYASETRVYRIARFLPGGAEIPSWNIYAFPCGMRIDADGNLVLSGLEVVQRFPFPIFKGPYFWRITPQGTILHKSAPGAAVLGLWKTQGMALDREGNAYVIETRRGRVVKLSPGGSILDSFPLTPFDRDTPTGIAVDADGSILLTLWRGNQVLELDRTGRLVSRWGGEPEELKGPSGVLLHDNGDMYIADFWHGRVARYRPRSQ